MNATETEPRQASTVLNGTYTMTSPKGGHRTFSIKTQPADSKFAPGKRILALLTGPDNEANYTSFAFVTDQGITVWRSKRGKGREHSAYDWYATMLWSLARRGAESQWNAKGYELLVEGRCLRCNRKLTDPVSISTGLGPICAGRE
jgi:hypothetical protein